MFKNVFNIVKEALFRSEPNLRTVSNEDLNKNQKLSRETVGRVENKCSWEPIVTTKRQKRIDTMVRSFAFYWGSILSDSQCVKEVVTEIGDCVLVDIHGSFESFIVFLMNEKREIEPLVVTYRRRTLMLTRDSTPLLDFLHNKALRPINRPLHVDPRTISAPIPTRIAHPFAIAHSLIQCGMLRPVTMKLSTRGRLPIQEMIIHSLTEEERTRLLERVHDRKDFGCERIWRFIGVSIDVVPLSLFMEDIVYGSVSEYIKSNLESVSPQQLLEFSLQTSEGLRYLEKHSFVHKRLSIDCCLLTADLNVKVAIYGLTLGELYPLKADLDEVDRARWAPYECLAPEGDKGLPYDVFAMIHTFGTVIWSIYHQAAIPFENETAEEIKSFEYRKENPLETNGGFMPESIELITQKCWHPIQEKRPRFKELKIMLRKLREK